MDCGIDPDQLVRFGLPRAMRQADVVMAAADHTWTAREPPVPTAGTAQMTICGLRGGIVLLQRGGRHGFLHDPRLWLRLSRFTRFSRKPENGVVVGTDLGDAWQTEGPALHAGGPSLHQFDRRFLEPGALAETTI